MSTATLFIAVKNWKQPSCPSMGKWVTNCGTSIQWKAYDVCNKKESTKDTRKNLGGSPGNYAE